MHKIKIVLDEEKIVREGSCSLEEMTTVVDEILIDGYGFTKGPDGFYLGRDDKSDFQRAACSIAAMKDESWFMDNVKTWLWLYNDDAYSPDDFATEDVKDYYLARRHKGVA